MPVGGLEGGQLGYVGGAVMTQAVDQINNAVNIWTRSGGREHGPDIPKVGPHCARPA